MSQDVITVEVYQGVSPSMGWSCSTGCTPGDSCGATETESVDNLKAELQRAYGDKVQFACIDTTQTSLDSFPLISRAVQMGYSFPITAINGQPRLAGGIDIDQIKKLLNEIEK